MDITDNHFYPIKESIEITGIPQRTLTRIAKKENARKVDGRYLFTGSQLKILIERKNLREKKRSFSQPLPSQNHLAKPKNDSDVEALIIENSHLKLEIENLKEELEEVKKELKQDIPHQEKLRNAIQLITLEALEQNVQHKIFTDEEYQDIIGTITEVDFQKEQVQYLRTRVEKQDEILNRLVKQASERNYIEAKEKGFDKD